MNRNFSLTVVLYLAVIAAAFAQVNQGISFLVQEPGAASPTGSFTVFLDSANPLNALITTTGPAGFGYAIAKPLGGGFYLAGTGVLESIDGAFATAPRIIAGLAGPPTAAVVTPDGKLLLVGASDSNSNGYLYVVDTNTDQVIGNGIPLSSPPAFQPGTPGFCPECFIAVSRDSTMAWVLTNTGIGSRLTAVNLVSRQIVGTPLVLSGGATSVTLSPLGLLYVTAANAIYEIIPSTLALTQSGYTQLFFSPYRLHFTPDGSNAYVVNLVPTSGGSILQYNVSTHQVLTWPPPQLGVAATSFDDIFIAGNNRIFAFSSALNAFADVTPGLAGTSGVAPSTLSIGPNNQQFSILAAAVSNEVPNAKFAFLLIGNGNQTNLYRMNLATNALDTQNQNVANLPVMQVVTVPPQSGAANFVTFNNTNQVLPTGGAAAPLLTRVTDINGLPVFNAQVTFTETDSIGGAVITNASTVTNADGYVTANVSIPNAAGTYNITLTVGSAQQVYALTVPGANGTGPNSGNSQVFIFTGDGQIILQNSTSAYPLTVLVTDTSGNPLPNIPVSFALTSGNCSLNGSTPVSSPSTVTDSNGLASTYFFGGQLAINTTVLPCTVSATTQFGSVTFNETIMLITLLPVAGNGIPEFLITQPTSDSARTITAPEGQPVPNAIVVQILATLFPQTGQPIPNIGIYTYNAYDQTQPPQASCVGSSNSDVNGIAHCTLVATCQLGNFQLGVAFGNPFLNTTFAINVVPGGPTKFNFISGNNQSGTAGQTLTSNLTATLTDGCNNIVPNTPVTWKVTQGSATLINTVNTTDGQGRVSTRVTLGQVPGPITVTVTATATGVTTSFTLTNSIIVAGITLVSGGGQTALIGTQFAQPLVFQVKDNNGKGVAGITVTFTSAGSGSATPGSATSDSTGKVQTVAGAGATPGPLVITATAGSGAGLSASATLTVIPKGPAVTATSFVNAASYLVGMVPCSLGLVTGNGVASGVSGVVQASEFGPLPFQLGPGAFQMTVQALGGVNQISVPISSVSNQNGVQQAVYQTPCELPPGLATVVVTANGASTTVNNVLVLAVQPGIFTFTGSNGKTYGAVFRAADGSYVLPGVPQTYARRGETYYVVVTGLGLTAPPAFTDSAGIPNQNVILQTVVGVNNAGVPVVSSQYAPGQIGVYVVAFQIPASFTPGPDQPLAVAIVQNGQTIFNNQVVLIGGVQ